ncbi:alpha-amylase family protein [Rapidithrix thailandica]|uniref:Alpha-amylase family protein n=1 Tax=Rapidithrix thailandica TaxID=413964 RepID=A0AAW9S7N9_9BACT
MKLSKIIIYQIFTRLFGNTLQTNKPFGTKEENGTGKFNDITPEALVSLRELGVTHVWYTGIIAHATLTDYTADGLPSDHYSLVKGRAGSPYAIKDYYDIAPDLAQDVTKRMEEFESLVARTHQQELKVLIDFIPNHVARSYKSLAKPEGVEDFGETDNIHQAFSPQNNFYYLPGSTYTSPKGAAIKALKNTEETYRETPAKATGNDCFSPHPSVYDWYETIKLNYGVDYQHGGSNHFDPLPGTWLKMRDILLFWASKKVDGFRCDMAEMVPVAFWGWVIPQVKAKYPELIFIAEAYHPEQQMPLIQEGHFDYLYDKTGIYDTLHAILTQHRPVSLINDYYHQSQPLHQHLVGFLENHDEPRLASKSFAQSAQAGIPAMTVTATLHQGPVLLYFGQEVGEPAEGTQGFSQEDGKTSIYDYCGVPEHQKWMNGGLFDGGLLTQQQIALRNFYQTLLNVCKDSPAIQQGEMYPLTCTSAGNTTPFVYTYLRVHSQETIGIVANFHQSLSEIVRIRTEEEHFHQVFRSDRSYIFTDILGSGKTLNLPGKQLIHPGITLVLKPSDAFIFRIEERESK